MRIMHEATLHSSNCFLTLTYDETWLPHRNQLQKRHLQRFIRRLRRAGFAVRYYAVGEYGEKTGRAHYHVCLFGENFAEDRIELRKTRDGHTLYTSPTLSELWPYGNHSIGELERASAAYVAAYVQKKKFGDEADWHYIRLDKDGYYSKEREFALMSLKPGIGAGWLKKWHEDVYKDDAVPVKGRMLKPPKYYDQLLDKIDPGALMVVKQKRREAAEEFAEANTLDRLAIRDRIMGSAEDLFRREAEI